MSPLVDVAFLCLEQDGGEARGPWLLGQTDASTGASLEGGEGARRRETEEREAIWERD